MERKIYKNQKGQTVGNLYQGIFRKEVDSRKHKMKIYDCYGLDLKILEDLIKNESVEIRIREKDTGHIYSSQVSQWKDFGHEHDFGDGKQTFLPMKYYQNAKQETLL